MAARYNLHQEANRIDMASLTDEIVLSNETSADAAAAAARVQLTTSRLHNPGRPGDLSTHDGVRVDAELSVAQETALLAWLAGPEDGEDDAETWLAPDELAALRARLAGLLDGLPDALRRHLEALMSGDLEIESPGAHPGYVDTIGERERADLEEAVRRLLHSLHGAPRSRRKIAARGTVDGARTMRANMGYDGVPFRPVTVARVADRPRLLLLVDVSLSVRTAARFTLQLVHGLQSMAAKVRSFAFVADLAEITDLFNEHHMEEALGLVMAGAGRRCAGRRRGLRLRRGVRHLHGGARQRGQPPDHRHRPRGRARQRQGPQLRRDRRNSAPRPGTGLADTRAPLLLAAGLL